MRPIESTLFLPTNSIVLVFQQQEDVEPMSQEPAHVRVLIPILVVQVFHSDALGPCTTMAVNMPEARLSGNFGFPSNRR